MGNCTKVDAVTGCRIASKLGAWFVGKDPYAHSFKPTLVAPPLTFFGELLAGVTENPDSMIRVTAEIPYALAAEPESNQLWTVKKPIILPE